MAVLEVEQAERFFQPSLAFERALSRIWERVDCDVELVDVTVDDACLKGEINITSDIPFFGKRGENFLSFSLGDKNIISLMHLEKEEKNLGFNLKVEKKN